MTLSLTKSSTPNPSTYDPRRTPCNCTRVLQSGAALYGSRRTSSKLCPHGRARGSKNA